ncbi:MAG: hypothetical protein K940chlam7_01946 [Chlamydiae bacterium]|nr:hypothetical protein [Chlamydiota bacterium]
MIREALFGGAAGGGKTDALLMGALQFVDIPGYSAILFRRTYKDLALPDAIMDRAHQWLQGTEAKWKGDDYVYIFPSTAKLTFGYMKTDMDRYRYQGAEFQYCVAEGTPVLLADGSYKPIEDIRINDRVMTLEGARRVIHVWGARIADCVKATTYDARGKYIEEQIHPVEHPVLMPKGWFSYADVSRPCAILESKQFGSAHKSSSRSSQIFPLAAQTCVYPNVSKPLHAQVQLQRDHPSGEGCAVSSIDDQNDYEESGGELPRVLQPQELIASVMLHAPIPHPNSLPSNDCVLLDASHEIELQGSLRHYFAYYHRDDALSLDQIENDQANALLPTDVGGHNPIYCSEDELVRVQGYNLPRLTSYVHPYTKEIRASSEGVQHGLCIFTPVGNHVVYDLTVEDAHHYITSSKLVNKNCGFDETTQFSEIQYTYLFSRLRRGATVNIPLRMRGASNPGGVGHDWVKQRFLIDGVRAGRVFIPAKLADNPSLDQVEYRASLMELDPVTRLQLLEGDWEARHGGSIFKREWFDIVNVMPERCRVARYWDLAATQPRQQGRDPDYTVGVKMGELNGVFFVDDVVRGQWSPQQVEQIVAQTAAFDGPDVQVYMEIEPGSSGVSLIDHYRRNVLLGYAFKGYKTTGKKELRAAPFSSAAEARNVRLVGAHMEGNAWVGGAWIRDFLEELEAFPYGAHDDQVDAGSGCFAVLAVTKSYPMAVTID